MPPLTTSTVTGETSLKPETLMALDVTVVFRSAFSASRKYPKSAGTVVVWRVLTVHRRSTPPTVSLTVVGVSKLVEEVSASWTYRPLAMVAPDVLGVIFAVEDPEHVLCPITLDEVLQTKCSARPP